MRKWQQHGDFTKKMMWHNDRCREIWLYLILVFFFFSVSLIYSRSPFQKVARPLPTFKNRWEKKIDKKIVEEKKSRPSKIKTAWLTKIEVAGRQRQLSASTWLPGWSPSVWPSGSGHFPAKNVKRAVRTHSKSLMAVHRYLKNTKLSYTTYISTFTYVFNHKFGSLYVRLANWPHFPHGQHMNMPKNWVFSSVLSFFLDFRLL